MISSDRFAVGAGMVDALGAIRADVRSYAQICAIRRIQPQMPNERGHLAINVFSDGSSPRNFRLSMRALTEQALPQTLAGLWLRPAACL